MPRGAGCTSAVADGRSRAATRGEGHAGGSASCRMVPSSKRRALAPARAPRNSVAGGAGDGQRERRRWMGVTSLFIVHGSRHAAAVDCGVHWRARPATTPSMRTDKPPSPPRPIAERGRTPRTADAARRVGGEREAVPSAVLPHVRSRGQASLSVAGTAASLACFLSPPLPCRLPRCAAVWAHPRPTAPASGRSLILRHLVRLLVIAACASHGAAP